MDFDTYRQLTRHRLKGRRFRILQPITTKGGITYPVGMVVRFQRKFGGFDIEGPPCPHCGVKVSVTRVHHSRLELLPPDEEAPPE